MPDKGPGVWKPLRLPLRNGWCHHGNLHQGRNHRVLLVPIPDVAWKYSVGTEIVVEELRSPSSGVGRPD